MDLNLYLYNKREAEGKAPPYITKANYIIGILPWTKNWRRDNIILIIKETIRVTIKKYKGPIMPLYIFL